MRPLRVLDFAEFYREVKDDCLLAVVVSTGERDTAQDLVAEAFARAWASWPSVSRHPAPAAWVVLNGPERLRVPAAPPPPGGGGA